VSPDAKVRGLARAAAARRRRLGTAAAARPRPGRRGAGGGGARRARGGGPPSRAGAGRGDGARHARARARRRSRGWSAVAPLGGHLRVGARARRARARERRPAGARRRLRAARRGDRTRLALSARFGGQHGRVRRRVAEVLGRPGEAAIPTWRGADLGPAGSGRRGARALGAIRTQAAADAALAFLANDYAQVRATVTGARAAGRRRPVGTARAGARTTRTAGWSIKVLRVLGAFGHSRILRHARQALRGKDVRLRANAVEALSSIPQRRFVLPVMHCSRRSPKRARAPSAAAAPGCRSTTSRQLTIAGCGWRRSKSAPLFGRPPRSALRTDPIRWCKRPSKRNWPARRRP
jgi:hypothetical protein